MAPTFTLNLITVSDPHRIFQNELYDRITFSLGHKLSSRPSLCPLCLCGEKALVSLWQNKNGRAAMAGPYSIVEILREGIGRIPYVFVQ